MAEIEWAKRIVLETHLVCLALPQLRFQLVNTLVGPSSD